MRISFSLLVRHPTERLRPILREAHRLTQPSNWELAVIGKGADPLPFPRGSVHLYFLRLTVASGCAQNKRSIFLDNFTSLVIGMHRLVVAPIAPNTKEAGFEEFTLSSDGTFDCHLRP
jgi:hypothetical protein